MKLLRPKKECNKIDGIINEDIRTEPGIFSQNQKNKQTNKNRK
jgi:hypothetical protein